MKKILKIPALLFALMLIVSSCGRSAKSDAETLSNDDVFELVSEAQNEDDSKKKIKLYKEAADMMEDFIEIHEYYMKDKDNYEKLVEAMEEVDEDEEMPSYKEYKKIMKPFIKDAKEDLEEWNEDLEKLKDGKSLVSQIDRDAQMFCELVTEMMNSRDVENIQAFQKTVEDLSKKYKDDEDAFEKAVEEAGCGF